MAQKKSKNLIIYFVFLTLIYAGLAAHSEDRIQPRRATKPISIENCQNALFPEFPCCGVRNELLDNSESSVNLGVNEFPWIVYINGTTTKKSCSGSLINSRWVLTTAQCVFNELGADWKFEVALKSEERENKFNAFEQQTFVVIKTVLHELYDSLTEKNSIALLLLNKPVIFDYVLKPICLPSNESVKAYAGEVGIVTLWEDNLALIASSVQILNLKTCMKLNSEKFLPEMCATRKNPNVTQYATLGGPLMMSDKEKHKFNIIGATHFPYGDPDYAEAYAYVNVSKYLKWIHETVLKYQPMLN